MTTENKLYCIFWDSGQGGFPEDAIKNHLFKDMVWSLKLKENRTLTYHVPGEPGRVKVSFIYDEII